VAINFPTTTGRTDVPLRDASRDLLPMPVQVVPSRLVARSDNAQLVSCICNNSAAELTFTSANDSAVRVYDIVVGGVEPQTELRA
jgi:hypothetical protein